MIVRFTTWVALAALLPVGCYRGTVDAQATEGEGSGSGGSAGSGEAGEGGEAAGEAGSAGEGETGGEPAGDGIGMMGLRRLSRDEYDNTVRDLVGDTTRPGSLLLPEDPVDPFDTAWGDQTASSTLIEALEVLAADITARLLDDPPRRDGVVGCTPTGPDDLACLESFVGGFGRLALRRPLEDTEAQAFLDLAQTWIAEENDFYAGVEVVIRALLQHPGFVYRVEIGTATADPGVFVLSDHEVATRLSYLLWGTTPDDALLDRADAGTLGTPDDVRAAALELLNDPRARDRVDRFHAMWLGYYRLPHDPELSDAMRAETRALLDRTIFEDRAPWLDLFTATGTFVGDLLAEHYGLPLPGSEAPTWVEYGGSGRQGLLSHGTFLSVAGKFGDTSPTQRGKLIRKRLLCQTIPPPPPDVNVDEAPESPDSDCKYDRYEAHRTVGACASCHNLMDPIGFGLENYDQTGAYREHDVGFPECTITGEGVLDGTTFVGPGGLAELLISRGLLDECIVEQLYEFAMGHKPEDADERYVDDLTAAFTDDGQRFDELLLDLVSDPAFSFRREEVP